MVNIYILVDPRDKSKVRYVGKTNGKLNERLNEHLYYAKSGHNKSYSGYWIRSLIKQNLKPLIILIEECIESSWEKRERHWIKFYRKNRHSLTNIENGGMTGVTIPIELRKERKGKEIYMHKNNRFIKKFNKVVEAAKYVNGNKHVVAACARGETFFAYGYQWAYKIDGFKSKKEGQAYKVFSMQYRDKEKIFYSTKEAMDYTGLSKSSINKCLNGERHSVFGYRFSHLKKGA